MIDPAFRNINRLFFLSFMAGQNHPARNSFLKYYMVIVEIKAFNALINNKPFFGQLIKNKEETREISVVKKR